MKYEVIDDSYGEIHGQRVYESDSRKDALEFYKIYESKGNNVAILQRSQRCDLEK
jgi:hypothetical protein